MLVDVAILGDTPFAIAAQDTVRSMGLTSYLVYTGEPGVRYVFAEPVDFPHVVCRHSIECSYGRGNRPNSGTSYLSGIHSDSFRRILGGNFSFFYHLASHVGDEYVDLRLASVPTDKLRARGGVACQPTRVGVENKFIALPDGEVVHYGKLLVCESLRAFLERVGHPSKFLVGKSIGVLVEESVSLLPPKVTLWAGGKPLPLASISRGFLTYYYFEEGRKTNLELEDYVKVPTADSFSSVNSLAAKDAHAYGPRGVWNTALTQSSELLRLADDFLDLP